MFKKGVSNLSGRRTADHYYKNKDYDFPHVLGDYITEASEDT